MTARFVLGDGPVRVGRARLALLAFLASRRAEAPFLLRRHGDATTEDVAWLGLDWRAEADPGAAATRYAEAADRLREAGRLYPCFETAEELRWKQQQRLRRGGSPVYDRAMLKMTAAQRATAEAGGKRPYWRFLLSEGEVGWRDLVAGRQSVRLATLSDPVLVQSDGAPTAPFAAAVDDLADRVTLLVRDADQVEASALHLDLVAALGGDAGRLALAHLPKPPADLATITLRRLRHDGVLPAALATLLARPDAPAPLDVAALVAGFDWRALAAAGPGAARLRELNRLALAALPFAAVADRLPEGATEPFWNAIRGGIDLLGEAKIWWQVVSGPFVPPVIDATLRARALRTMPDAPWDAATWQTWANSTGDAAALRLVLTGEEAGPDMALLLKLIGPEQVRRRLASG